MVKSKIRYSANSLFNCILGIFRGTFHMGTVCGFGHIMDLPLDLFFFTFGVALVIKYNIYSSLSYVADVSGSSSFNQVPLLICGKKLKFISGVIYISVMFGIGCLLNSDIHSMISNFVDIFIDEGFEFHPIQRIVIMIVLSVFLFPFFIKRDNSVFSFMAYISLFTLIFSIISFLRIGWEKEWFLEALNNSSITEFKVTEIPSLMITSLMLFFGTPGVMPNYHGSKGNTLKNMKVTLKLYFFIIGSLYLILLFSARSLFNGKDLKEGFSVMMFSDKRPYLVGCWALFLSLSSLTCFICVFGAIRGMFEEIFINKRNDIKIKDFGSINIFLTLFIILGFVSILISNYILDGILLDWVTSVLKHGASFVFMILPLLAKVVRQRSFMSLLCLFMMILIVVSQIAFEVNQIFN